VLECVLVVVGRGGAANHKAAHQGHMPIDGAAHMSCKVVWERQ
jgi:hypothetical protein